MKKIISIFLLLTFAITGCASNKTETDKTLDEIWASYEKSVSSDERADAIKLDKITLESVYGITYSEVVEYVAYIPGTTSVADEAIIVKVIKGRKELVRAKYIERQRALEAIWTLYGDEEQLEYVKNYQIIDRGDYILFTIGPNSDKIIKAFESAF